jgi:hypothetical protein
VVRALRWCVTLQDYVRCSGLCKVVHGNERSEVRSCMCSIYSEALDLALNCGFRSRCR